ncbi:MAG: PorT family protein [Ignavibacteria bacterium]|nr:PorT family protein [Ignavibacteria bacterium]
MKKLLLPLILLMLSQTDVSSAQVIKSCGLKFAITSASQTFEYSNPPWSGFGPTTVRRTGFNIGAFVEWFDIPYLSAISQIEYAQRGVGEEFIITGSDPTTAGTKHVYTRLDYLSVPILAKPILPMGMVSPYLLVGPRADFLLHYQKNLPLEGFYKDFKKTAIGGTIGVGVESSSLLPIRLSVESRYNFDISNSFDNGFAKVRNNAFDFWLGVGF